MVFYIYIYNYQDHKEIQIKKIFSAFLLHCKVQPHDSLLMVIGIY